MDNHQSSRYIMILCLDAHDRYHALQEDCFALGLYRKCRPPEFPGLIGVSVWITSGSGQAPPGASPRCEGKPRPFAPWTTEATPAAQYLLCPLLGSDTILELYILIWYPDVV